jgi:predicted transcriptional regulator
MTTEPEVLRPHDSIAYAINRMVVRGFRNIPIVDDGNKAVAVLDVRDVMAHLADLFAELAEGRRVESEWDEWTDIGGG